MTGLLSGLGLGLPLDVFKSPARQVGEYSRQDSGYSSVHNVMQQQLSQLTAQELYNNMAQAQAQAKPNLDQVALELLYKRMSGVRGQWKLKATQDFLHTHVCDDTVFLFFVIDGKEGMLKEHADLFPSDTLITQLRLIIP